MAAHPPKIRASRGGIQTINAVMFAIIVVLLAFLASVVYSPDMPPPPTAVACSTEFLDTGDFDGDWVPNNVTNYIVGGSSRFSGTIMMANVDSNLVEAVLPTNWSLADPVDASELCHPVLILFGEQSQLQTIFLDQGTPVGGDDASYQEMMLLIPFTQRDVGGPLWHTSVIRMYLDDQAAKDIGNDYYAYNKELATFTDSGSIFSVFPNGSIAFHATYSPSGTLQNFNVATLPNLDEIKKILAMPLVGVVNDTSFSPPIEWDRCSYFDMVYDHGDGTHARVRSTQVQHDYFKPFVPAMTPWIGLPPSNNSTNGAIEVENLGWKLMFPAKDHCKYKVTP